MPILILGDNTSDLRGALRLEECRGGTAVTLLALLGTPLTDREVIRLYLLCGADRAPHKISLITTQGNEAVLEGTFRIPAQYDGAAVIRCNTDTREEHIMATGFWGNPYPVADFFRVTQESTPPQPAPESAPQPVPDVASKPTAENNTLRKLQQSEAYRAFTDMSDEIESPIRRALDTLEAIRTLRRTRSQETGLAGQYFTRLCEKMRTFPQASLHIPEGYRWYRVTSPQPPVELSALYHLLASPQALFSVGKHGGYLLGVKEQARRIAVALPAPENGACPFANAADCCVFLQSGGTLYAVVGIELAEDGQYFVPVTSINSPDLVQDTTNDKSGEEISS